MVPPPPRLGESAVSEGLVERLITVAPALTAALSGNTSER
jgi:hypothetical protein